DDARCARSREREAAPSAPPSELIEEVPDGLIDPAAAALSVVRIRRVIAVEGAELDGVAGHAPHLAGADVSAAIHLRRGGPGAAVGLGEVLRQTHAVAVVQHR